MAKTITQLTELLGANVESTDLLPIYDGDATTTKKISIAELGKTAIDFYDTTFSIVDNSDPTKKVQFQVSGVSTGTTRTITIPNNNITLVGTTNSQTITNKIISPASNTIDGDVLDITFTPTNYTPTTTGAPEASDVDDLTAHLKGIDNELSENKVDEFFIYPTVNSAGATANPFTTSLGDYQVATIASGQSVRFHFKVPDNFVSLIELVVVMIPDATETIQWDVTTDYGGAGQAYNTHSGSISNATASSTTNQVIEADISSAVSLLASGDYVGVVFSSDTTNLRVIGLQFKYNRTN